MSRDHWITNVVSIELKIATAQARDLGVRIAAYGSQVRLLRGDDQCFSIWS